MTRRLQRDDVEATVDIAARVGREVHAELSVASPALAYALRD